MVLLACSLKRMGKRQDARLLSEQSNQEKNWKNRSGANIPWVFLSEECMHFPAKAGWQMSKRDREKYYVKILDYTRRHISAGKAIPSAALISSWNILRRSFA